MHADVLFRALIAVWSGAGGVGVTGVVCQPDAVVAGQATGKGGVGEAVADGNAHAVAVAVNVVPGLAGKARAAGGVAPAAVAGGRGLDAGAVRGNEGVPAQTADAAVALGA